MQARAGILPAQFCPEFLHMMSFARPASIVGTVLFALISLVPAAPSLAQERLARSDLAGVAFPEPSWAWNEDPNGVKRESMDDAAKAAERSCGRTEFHAFQTADAEQGSALRQRTEEAFGAGGWRLDAVAAADADQPVLHAAKDGAELVLTWIPVDSGIALFLCEAFPVGAAPAQAADSSPDAASEAAPAEAADDDGLDLSKAPWMFFAVFGAIGAFVLAAGIRNRRRAAASLSWPEAAGTILSAEVVERHETDSEGDTTEYHVPTVRYRYEVGGRPYEGARLRFGDMRQHSYEAARKMLDRYRPGEPVSVRHDPAKPSEATLETAKPGLGAPLFIGGIFLFFAALALLVALGSSA